MISPTVRQPCLSPPVGAQWNLAPSILSWKPSTETLRAHMLFLSRVTFYPPPPHEHMTSCLRKSFLFSTFLVFSSGETLLVSELILRVLVSGCSDYRLENDIVSDLSQMVLELFVVT